MSSLVPLKKQRFVAFYVVFTALAMGGSLIYSELPHSGNSLRAGMLPRIEQPSIAKKPVFQLTSAFSAFETRANYLVLNDPYDYKTGKEIKNSDDMKALTIKRMDAYDKARQHLKEVLEKALPNYDESLQSDIRAFLTWLNRQPASSMPINHGVGSQRRDAMKKIIWSQNFRQLKRPIYKQLRDLNGFADIESPEDAAIMLAVPKAKEALENQPNDATLCTVMTHWKKHFKSNDAGRKLMAQQIAFFEVGSKYCPNYFHRPAGWGALYEGDQSYHNSTNPYDKLSYKDYYNKELLPRLPEAEKIVKQELSKQGKYANQILCNRYPMSASTMQRNPKEDAKQLAYKLLKNKTCTSPKLMSFLDTPLLCLMKAGMFCKQDHKCDTIQRCIKQTKPIFGEK